MSVYYNSSKPNQYSIVKTIKKLCDYVNWTIFSKARMSVLAHSILQAIFGTQNSYLN